MTITMIIMTAMEIIMMSIINNILCVDFSSFAGGLLSSAAVWWLINLFNTPKIIISSEIVFHRKNPYSCLIKIQNKSYFKDVYNIVIHTVYCTANESYHREELATIAYLKHRPLWKKVNEISQKEKPYEMKIRVEGPKKNMNERIALESFLSKTSRRTTNKAFLDIVAICYDKKSGTTKKIIVQRYFAKDIIHNAHFEDGSVEVIRNNSDEKGTQK